MAASVPTGRALLDTSVVIDLAVVDVSSLPEHLAVSAISLAELAAGPHATADAAERAARQDRLQWVEATFDPLPFDAEAARAYGRVFAAVSVTGRSARPRFADLFIAATALANDLELVTRDASDLVGLESLVAIREV
jgi:predicted nucleic acid-binding protein